MRTSVTIVSALAAAAAAHTSYTTVDVTVTSCGPEVSSCPGEHPTAPPEPQTVYSTVGVTITSCGPEVSSCPGKPTPPASHPPSGESIPASVSSVPELSVDTGPVTPTVPSPSYSAPPAPPPSSVPVVTHSENSYPPAPPAEHSSVSPASSAGYPSKPSGPASSVPYPTSIVTVISTSKGPVGTGTGVVPPVNATSTHPPIASFTGAASSISGSYGVVAGLAAIGALFMAYLP